MHHHSFQMGVTDPARVRSCDSLLQIRALVNGLWSLSSVLGGRQAGSDSFEKHLAYREIPSAGSEIHESFCILFLMKMTRAENVTNASFYFQEIPVSIPLVIFGVRSSRQ